MAVYVPSGTTRLLYLGVSYDAGSQVCAWDGATATSLITLEGATAEHLFAFDGKLYVAVADAGGNGLLYSYDGTDWRLVATLAENWVQSGAALGTSYYLGSGRDNRIWQFNGRDLVEVLAGFGPSGTRVRGMVAFRGRLYAGLAWSDSFRTVVASADGTAWHELRPDGLTAAGAGGLGVRHLGALNGDAVPGRGASGGNRRAGLQAGAGQRLQRGGHAGDGALRRGAAIGRQGLAADHGNARAAAERAERRRGLPPGRRNGLDAAGHGQHGRRDDRDGDFPAGDDRAARSSCR